MNAEYLLSALGDIREQWIEDAAPKHRKRKRRSCAAAVDPTVADPAAASAVSEISVADRAGMHIWLPLAVCLAAVVAVLWLAPSFVHTPQDIDVPGLVAATGTGEDTQAINREPFPIVVIYSQEQLQTVLDGPGPDVSLQDWLKATGLWDQHVVMQEDLAWLQGILRDLPIPTIQGKMPYDLVINGGLPYVVASFDRVTVQIPTLGQGNRLMANFALPEDSVQVSSDPLLVLTERPTQAGMERFRFVTVAMDRPVTVYAWAKELDEAIGLLEGLSFAYSPRETIGQADLEHTHWGGVWVHGELKLEPWHINSQDVQIFITELDLDMNAATPYGAGGTVSLSLSSREERTVWLTVSTELAGDRFATVETLQVTIPANGRIDLSDIAIEGWNGAHCSSFDLRIKAGDSRMEITVYTGD